jgi:hypothetical protein
VIGTAVQAPRRNIELKVTDPDPSASLEVCRALGAEDQGTIAPRYLLRDCRRRAQAPRGATRSSALDPVRAELRDALGITDDRLIALGYAAQMLRASGDTDAS